MIIYKLQRRQLYYSLIAGIFTIFILLYFINLLRNNCLKSAIYQYEVLEEFLVDDEKSQDYNEDQKEDDTKYILLWTKFFGDKKWGLENDHEDQKYFEKNSCPYTNCVITNNKRLKQPYLFDAVIFHGAETWDLQMPPQYRSPHQLYVMGSMESPSEVKHKLDLDHDFYNLTSE